MRRMSSALSRLNAALRLALALGLAAYLIYFVAHAWLMLNFPFPLDYGEGPLLAQADLLRGGLPFWRLYADPALPPYAIVNYPPLYLLLTAALSPLVGGALAAGRLLSLLAAAGCVAALYQLADGGRRRVDGRRGFQLSYFSFHISAFAPLLLLTVPIVREWLIFNFHAAALSGLLPSARAFRVPAVRSNSGRSSFHASLGFSVCDTSRKSFALASMRRQVKA